MKIPKDPSARGRRDVRFEDKCIHQRGQLRSLGVGPEKGRVLVGFVRL